MSAKFIVVECNDNSSALEMVRLMLEHGYVRLMLLDDLSQHPSLRSSRNTPPRKTSPPASEDKTAKNNALKDLLTASAKALPDNRIQSDKESSDLLELFNLSSTDMFNVKEEHNDDEHTADSYADEEIPFQFDLGASSSQLDFLAQAHCLAGAASPSENGPPTKKARSGDPEKDYHTCQICSTRVKAPRGGRWNLQMHILAMHSSQRPFKCPECCYTDYRKPGMRKHTMMNHGQDLDPVDICTDEKRSEWDRIMGQCFPEFAYRTGFLATATSQGAFSVGSSEKGGESTSD